MSYYIINQRGSAINISADETMSEFCVPQKDITEHLQAQLSYLRTQDKTHKIEPIVIGVTTEKFLAVVDHLCQSYPGFLKNYFVHRNMIPIKLKAKGSEIIRIIDSEKLVNE